MSLQSHWFAAMTLIDRGRLKSEHASGVAKSLRYGLWSKSDTYCWGTGSQLDWAAFIAIILRKQPCFVDSGVLHQSWLRAVLQVTVFCFGRRGCSVSQDLNHRVSHHVRSLDSPGGFVSKTLILYPLRLASVLSFLKTFGCEFWLRTHQTTAATYACLASPEALQLPNNPTHLLCRRMTVAAALIRKRSPYRCCAYLWFALRLVRIVAVSCRPIVKRKL